MILDTAHDLFLAYGYGRTTIAAIAEKAGVSRQTIYDTVGSKREVLEAVLDRLVTRQDDPVTEITDAASWSEVATETDPGARLALAAQLSRQVWESGLVDLVRTMLSAAAVDPELADWPHEQILVRRRNMETLARLLFAPDRLEDDFQDVVDLLAALDSGVVVGILVNDFGWSYDKYEEWLGKLYRRLFPLTGTQPEV
ncbi:TetR/AcrR family transcriptional regulator [Nitriliruptor alkaliphilus]|uniref:TetR/AcrR family transcriptional regulator n=1 Tax=Nitriliruptor alkaliphilus TaxID=427918 RepID=UPI0006964222|nr:TetR/AcrR family transcriptional regulator [Nitriliruptor alkaliphilus]